MSDVIMLTVKPRHIANMRKGRKKYELRKSRPAKPGGRDCRVFICESGSGGQVVAEFTCPAMPEMTTVDATRVAVWACVGEEDVERYRADGRLFGWLVTHFIDYKAEGRVQHITDFGLTCPPQSWCYVREARECKTGQS